MVTVFEKFNFAQVWKVSENVVFVHWTPNEMLRLDMGEEDSTIVFRTFVFLGMGLQHVAVCYVRTTVCSICRIESYHLSLFIRIIIIRPWTTIITIIIHRIRIIITVATTTTPLCFL